MGTFPATPLLPLNATLDICEPPPFSTVLADLPDDETAGLMPIVSDDEAGAVIAGHVLLLDDDASFKEIIEGFLVECGYEVVAVESGVEGVKEILERDFEIILCDMQMPGLPGDMFYRAVERTRPHLLERFVFMTGYRGNTKSNDFIKEVNGCVLMKPFPLADLLDTIAFLEIRRQYLAPLPAQDPYVAPERIPMAPAPDRCVVAVKPAPPAPCPVATPRTPSRPPHASARPARRVSRVFLALLLLAALGAPAGWLFQTMREQVEQSTAERASIEVQWERLTSQIRDSERALAHAEPSLNLWRALEKDRDEPMWTLLLPGIALAAGRDIELTSVRKVDHPTVTGEWELIVEGISAGPAPEENAKAFAKKMRASLEEKCGENQVGTRVERLESDAESGRGPIAHFTIVATADLGNLPTLQRSSLP